MEAREAAGDKVVDLGMPEFVGRVVKEPLGVVALITPWNYPALVRPASPRTEGRTRFEVTA